MGHDVEADLVPVTSSHPSIESSLGALVERAKQYASRAHSPSTLKAYATNLIAYEAWCDEHGFDAYPGSPAQVSAFLAHLADLNHRPSYLERVLAAVAYGHRSRGFVWPKGQPLVREVMAGIRRAKGSAPDKKAAIETTELSLMMDTLTDDLVGIRDRALLTLGWFGALRRSEVVALQRSDVTFVREGLLIVVRRSKRDQEGRGLEKGIPYAGDVALCPVRSLQLWLETAQINQGPLFRGINRWGKVSPRSLCDRSVALIVKRAALAAGLDPEIFAGHSLRAGFATAAARKGKSLDSIMRQTGHRSERIARGYIRHGTVFVDNAATGLV